MCLICLTNKLPHTLYCERGLSPALFAEPINAFTNFAFIIAGFLARKTLLNHKIKSREVSILPWFLVTIGVGSFIFHTARNSITLVLDAVPIYIFILYALFLILKELFENKTKSFLILLSFFLLEVSLTIFIPKEFMNGSIRHIAAILFISGLGVLLIKKYGEKVKSPLFSVLVLYGGAIFFRSIDSTICLIFPMGTHFLWHMLAAFAGYNAIKLLAVIKERK